MAALPDQVVRLNSSKFAATPGASFSLEITARVPPGSVGSGYFTIIFLAAGGGRSEVSRQSLGLQPATVALETVTTNAEGAYSVSLPPEVRNARQIRAEYPGNGRYWPAVTR